MTQVTRGVPESGAFGIWVNPLVSETQLVRGRDRSEDPVA